MNLRDLRYFAVLAEVRHFGEAAKRCFVSQPTLSMQIKKLEQTLGVALFERSNKEVLLTDQGKLLLPTAKKILLLADEMNTLAQQGQDPFSGELRLGIIPTVAPYLLPLIMPMLHKQYPELKIWLIEEQTQALCELLKEGALDAALMADPIAEPLLSQHLYNESFYFACAQSHPLASHRTMSVDDLAGQQIFLLEQGHCLRQQAMAVCQMAKAEGSADFTATSLETLRFMVQAGIGVTLLPALAAHSYQSDLLCCIPFNEPAPCRSLSLFSRPANPKKICIKAIAASISEGVRSHLN